VSGNAGTDRVSGGLTSAAVLVLGLVAVAGVALAGAVPATAQASGLVGEAYGHYTNVSLFGGPKVPVGPDPQVALPADGSTQPVTAIDSDGATAQYGPARIFAGIWPDHVQDAPPSGPITVSTKGTPGPNGSVTSTVDIGLFPKPLPVACDNDPPGKTSCTAPGGFGPLPVTQGEQLHSTCTAGPNGVTGSVSFVKAVVAKSTNLNGDPTDIEPIPDKPPVGYSQTGTITNVGDNWKVVYNEQTVDADGSITVNAIHMFLLGPIAIGEQIVGHVRCAFPGGQGTGPTSSAPSAATAAPSTTGLAPSTTVSVPTTAASPRSAAVAKEESGMRPVPLVAIGAVIAVAGSAVTVARRRARARRRAATAAPP
jgi:hypothetical protein